FASTVLLRQGAAEKLIDADKDVRREVFRSLIDLDPYIQLHDKVAASRADLAGQARRLRTRLGELPIVSDDQVREAEERQQVAELEAAEARGKENAARDRLGHARTWEQLEQTRLRVHQELDAALRRAPRAGELERQFQRLRELEVLVPSLRRVAGL